MDIKLLNEDYKMFQSFLRSEGITFEKASTFNELINKVYKENPDNLEQKEAPDIWFPWNYDALTSRRITILDRNGGVEETFYVFDPKYIISDFTTMDKMEFLSNHKSLSEEKYDELMSKIFDDKKIVEHLNDSICVVVPHNDSPLLSENGMDHYGFDEPRFDTKTYATGETVRNFILVDSRVALPLIPLKDLKFEQLNKSIEDCGYLPIKDEEPTFMLADIKKQQSSLKGEDPTVTVYIGNSAVSYPSYEVAYKDMENGARQTGNESLCFKEVLRQMQENPLKKKFCSASGFKKMVQDCETRNQNKNDPEK